MNKKDCNWKKILIGVSVGIIILASAVGIYLYVNRFNASEYVQAVLDVSYKNKTTLYQEVADVSEKEAKAVFEKNLDATMKGFDTSDMPDSLKGKYRELFGEIAKKVNYTVGEAKKEKDGTYTVSVKIKPITLFTDTYDTFLSRAEQYAKEVTDHVTKGAQMPTDEEMQEKIYQIYYEVLKEQTAAGMLYGRAADVVLHIEKAGRGIYEIRQKDMEKLDGLLIEEVHPIE